MKSIEELELELNIKKIRDDSTLTDADKQQKIVVMQKHINSLTSNNEDAFQGISQLRG
jgi:hypothetical protein